MKKKVLAILMVMTMMVTLVACGNAKPEVVEKKTEAVADTESGSDAEETKKQKMKKS